MAFLEIEFQWHSVTTPFCIGRHCTHKTCYYQPVARIHWRDERPSLRGGSESRVNDEKPRHAQRGQVEEGIHRSSLRGVEERFREAVPLSWFVRCYGSLLKSTQPSAYVCSISRIFIREHWFSMHAGFEVFLTTAPSPLHDVIVTTYTCTVHVFGQPPLLPRLRAY